MRLSTVQHGFFMTLLVLITIAFVGLILDFLSSVKSPIAECDAFCEDVR